MLSVIYGTGIEGMRNIMLMDAEAYIMFGDCALWLEAEDNSYRICAINEGILIGYPDRRVIFNTSAYADDEKTPLPPPDPKVLATHAASAQVVNLSGVREYMEEIVPNAAEAPWTME
ncbi:hypothetical protein FA95DRAFT_1561794 [Auriscalpium vulgare]|uniref:Uncharacterized protein n=1 Tax=Auriscalpium vulgare TaxID=40419 RepID=A0ACB8RLR0_9AGAM|nr:hypothetical protein FA95DRAFT_1561794 [Auriscalpium vulgare]